MNFQVTGKIVRIFDAENKSGTFNARDFVIEVPGQYPQFVKFQLVQDKVGLIDDFAEGQEVTVHFDLRGREWQGKYFTNLHAWKIDGQAQAEPAYTVVGEKQPPAAPPIGAGSEPDGLPF